jgi:hypothetical protein
MRLTYQEECVGDEKVANGYEAEGGAKVKEPDEDGGDDSAFIQGRLNETRESGRTLTLQTCTHRTQ